MRTAWYRSGWESPIREFIGSVVGMALRPQRTTVRLLENPHRLRQGIAACLLMGVLYTISVFVGYLHGFGAVMEPWLPIPAADYYLWETFFTIPAFFLILATASAATQLAARALRGRGTFKDTGFHGIDLVRRDGPEEVEFVTVMWFETMDAVRAFAGIDHEVAVVPPEARQLLARFDDRSVHYDVVERRRA